MNEGTGEKLVTVLHRAACFFIGLLEETFPWLENKKIRK
jgi:hypothetical protein